jgi:hypothetical protein
LLRTHSGHPCVAGGALEQRLHVERHGAGSSEEAQQVVPHHGKPPRLPDEEDCFHRQLQCYGRDGVRRTQASLDGFRQTLTDEQARSIQPVAMDMWDTDVNSTRQHVTEADSKIVFDKFHIAKHLSDAVDKVRRRENKLLRAWATTGGRARATTGSAIRRPWNPRIGKRSRNCATAV